MARYSLDQDTDKYATVRVANDKPVSASRARAKTDSTTDFQDKFLTLESHDMDTRYSFYFSQMIYCFSSNLYSFFYHFFSVTNPPRAIPS